MTDIALDLPRRDFRVVSLIGVAHGASHFFQLVLPPLFPLLKDAFGVDFFALGVLMAVYSGTSAISQIIAGFVVDRLGAQRVLPVGLACLGLAMLGVSLVHSYWMLLPFAALGGIGNSVFHPADYSVLTARVTPTRLARAYSIHTVSGTVGWTLAPVTMFSLAEWFGWRAAVMAVGVAGLALAAVVAAEHNELRTVGHAGSAKAHAGGGGVWSLISAPIVMAFVYFALLALAGGATQNFFPTMLPTVQGVTLALATTITTVYLAASAFGSFAGGYLADKTADHDRVIGAGLGSAALLALLIGFVPMPAVLVFVAASVMGFLAGITIPSRDMLVRAATPAGATGKVFGFVYSGLDLGSLVAPVVVGAMIDHGHTRYAFLLIAVAFAATVAAAVAVKQLRRERA